MNRSAVTTALALASLSIAPVAAQNRAVVPPLTIADTNRIIAAPVGRILTVDLRQSAGTRSNWRMVPVAGLVQVGPSTVRPVPHDAPPVAGSAGIRTFRVRVTAPGELSLTFVNAATFGGSYQAAETATFVIAAK